MTFYFHKNSSRYFLNKIVLTPVKNVFLQKFLLLFIQTLIISVYLFSLPRQALCDIEEDIKNALNQVEAEFFSRAYVKTLREVMRQSMGEIPELSLRANAVSEAIPTEIASSPSAPRNDYSRIPPFTDRLLRERIKEQEEELSEQKTGFHLKQQGTLRQETAYRVSDKREFTKIKNQLILSQTGKFSENARFKISGRAYYDAVYDLNDNYGRAVRSDQLLEAELRDTYIDYSAGPWDIRLGKQQIVWGEAVGLFFADVVNAKDLREYVLPDFELIRIPEWALDLEYSQGDFHSEFIWLPASEFNKIGVSGSEFEFPLPVPEGTASTKKDPIEPAEDLRNSQLGLRLSYIWSGWDWGIFYLYSWDKTPVNFRTINSGRFDFSPGYKRMHILGSTFAKTLNDIVLKGEFVFNRKGAFSIFDTNDIDGIVQRNFLDYLFGADYTFFGKLDTNLQFMQRIIFNHSNLLADNEDEFRSSVSFRLKTDFLDDRLEPEFLVIASLMEPDLLYRSKISYKISDSLRLRLGADIFQGPVSGIFGRFAKKSRIYSEVIYSF